MAPFPAVDLLIDIARRKCDETSAALTTAMSRCQAAEQKLDLLNRYRSEYLNRRKSTDLTCAELLCNFNAFMEKLDLAISSQTGALTEARRLAHLERQRWESARRQVKAMEVIRERRNAAERILANRIQQKLHDELAGRMSRQAMALAD
jgi:flagellar FliJ protein